MDHKEFIQKMNEVKDYANYMGEFLIHANSHLVSTMFRTCVGCIYIMLYLEITNYKGEIKSCIEFDMGEE